MTDLRIVDAPVLLQESITDDVKMPTGGLGNFSVRLGDILWYVITKEQLANKNYVDLSSKSVKDSLDEHIADKANPHQVTKEQVGLGNVDNTADIDKPVSNAVNSAIITATNDMATKTYVNQKDNLKADKATTLSGYGIIDAYTKDETYSQIEINSALTLKSDVAYVDGKDGDLTTLKTTDKTNLVKAVNEIHDVTKGVVALYDRNVEAGAGANGWTDLFVTTQNGRTQRQKNLDTVNLLDYMTANELSAYQADATTFNAAPVFNRASIDCYNKKRKLLAYGTFYTTETIVITSDCDLSQADIFTTASLAIDVRNVVDTATIKRLISYNITLPRNVKYTQKPSAGWIAGTIGIKLTNLYSCKVWFGRTTGFETNNHIYSDGTGNVYNEYMLGWCENGKINLLLDASATGWTNENNFYGGRYSHESAEGINVAGTRHIKIANAAHAINNNVFYKPSVEADIAEYHVENGGSYNTIICGRWEATTPKVLYFSDDNSTNAANFATGNLITGGYRVDDIAITNVGTKSAFGNRLIGLSRELNPISGTNTGGHRYKNRGSSAYAVMTGFDAGADLANIDVSQYTWSLSSLALNAKRGTDAYPRISLDFSSGRLLIGNGTVDPTVGLKSTGSYVFWTGGDYAPSPTGTYNLGTTSYKWKQLYLSDGFGAFGSAPPATKPSVTGSRGGNAALASLITALASYGLITDNTTA